MRMVSPITEKFIVAPKKPYSLEVPYDLEKFQAFIANISTYIMTILKARYQQLYKSRLFSGNTEL